MKTVTEDSIGGRILFRGVYRQIVAVTPDGVTLSGDKAVHSHETIWDCIDQMGLHDPCRLYDRNQRDRVHQRGSFLMTADEVDRRVADIERLVGERQDCEAHELEVELMQDFVVHVRYVEDFADFGELAEMAESILRTAKLKFSRLYG